MEKLIEALRMNADAHPLDVHQPVMEQAAAALESQAREIERLHKDYDEASEDAMTVARQLAALKAGQDSLILARDEQKRMADEYRELWSKAAVKAQPASGGDERAAFELDIPTIVATFDGRYLVPVVTLKAGEHLMTVAQHLRIEKQLRAALPVREAVAVPDGYVLVPVEPTNAMTHVGQSLRYDSANSIGHIYRAMLAAAPSPNREGE